MKGLFGKIIFTSLFYYSVYFLLLFTSFNVLFVTIHKSHYTTSANFYLCLQYFQQKIFSFNKINESQIDPLCEEEENSISVRLAWIIFANLFYYSTYFCNYSWVTLHFLVLFISITILFQLTFTFIYSTFSKKFLVSAK